MPPVWRCFCHGIFPSITVILIGLPWWLMTPLSDRAITLFENYLPGGNKQILNK
ncbi:hypothetical protein GRK22_003953 [Salmonella enterica]|nr:hypothetical protein [Salmonella enterica]EEH6953391.1 hypothetical protein [Salmonella enterica subsp. enterica serovar Dublin]